MRHHYTIEEGLYRLRPVSLNDAAFIVELRNDPRRNRFIHATPSDVELQQDWLLAYFERPGDYYFVIERTGNSQPEGALGIYDVDEAKRSAEWGRWIVRIGSKAAVPSCCLAFDMAFSALKLESLHSYVAAEHRDVIRLLRAMGMKQEASLPGRLSLNGASYAALKMVISASDWLLSNHKMSDGRGME